MKTDFEVVKTENKEKTLLEISKALSRGLHDVLDHEEKDRIKGFFAIMVVEQDYGTEYQVLAIAEEQELKHMVGGSLIALGELGIKEAPEEVSALFKLNDNEKALEKAFSVKASEPDPVPEEKTAPAPEEKQEEKEFSFLVTFNDRTEKEFSATGVNDVEAYEKVIQDIKENHAPLYPISVTSKEV